MTRAGDLLSRHRAWGGSAAAPSALHLQAALDEARARRGRRAACERGRFELARRRRGEGRGPGTRRRALDRLHASDAAHSRSRRAARTARLRSPLGAAEAHRSRRIEAAARTLEEDSASSPSSPSASRPPRSTRRERGRDRRRHPGRDGGRAGDSRPRARETEARLGLRTSEERARALSGRAESLERAARAEREARGASRAREAAAAPGRGRRGRAGRGHPRARACSTCRCAGRPRERDAAEAERRAGRRGHRVRGAEVEAAPQSSAELTDVAHRDEVARAQQRLRVEALQARAVDDLGPDPAVLVEEFGPHRPCPAPRRAPRWTRDAPTRRPYVREQQEKRLRAAERAMAQLGRVNPLALEEFAALEERHTFLTEQLADLKQSRADLLEIVKEIDERVERVFTEAFHDTGAQFDEVFPRLFPGGEGRLVLTDPANMLTTGIEVEARPAGKKVKRLSLLSGGERSLTAVALLVAIFKARPSPFYVMDEVEAALDDTNLGRLLEIFVELQRDSQLIVITHQKRTMEIADALYGVTMRGDGVTTVISQRIREVVAV